MGSRRSWFEAGALLALALVAGTISNATAGKERRLKWIGQWEGAPAPPAATPAATSPASGGAPGAGEPAAPGADFEVGIDRVAAEHAAGALFLDARRSEDYAAGHIAGARSFAVWESDVDDKVLTLLSEIPTDRRIVVYCSGGKCEDSHLLRGKLLSAGFTDVLVYKDGWPDWQKRGLAVEP